MNREIPEHIRKTFPYVGDIAMFTGVPKFYYPMYIDMGREAKEKLNIGQEYTIRKVEIYSSWCCVWLVGVGEGDESLKSGFNMSFFKIK